MTAATPRDVRRGSPSRRVIAVGGASTSGKSTLAQQLSTASSLPWISTDQVRELLRAALRPEQLPDLFPVHTGTAEQYADAEWRQALAVAGYVTGFVRDDYTWPGGFIIEGIHLIPEVVAALRRVADVTYVPLEVPAADWTAAVLTRRRESTGAALDGLPDEVAGVGVFGERLRVSAERHGCGPLRTPDEALAECMAALRQ